jgi:hypothetical protein
MVLLGLVLLPIPLTHAQEGGLRIEQSESALFGESISLTLKVDSPTVITGAQLVLQAADRDPIIQNVPITPGTTVSASYRLDVNAAHIPPFASITYRWQLSDETGGQINSDPRTFRYEDNRVPWEWQTVVQDNVVVHTSGHDALVSQAALDTTIEAQARINQTLQAPLPPEIHVYVYPELAQLASALRLHERTVQDWVAAYTLPDQSVILVAASPGPEMVPGLQRDIPHELTHLLVYASVGPQGIGNVPGWFNEGLALMSAYEPDPSLAATLDEVAREGVLLSMETLCVSDFTDLPPRDAALAYAQSLSLTRYISDRYGDSQIRAMMAAYANGASCSAGTQVALGISLSTLESQWHASLLGDLSRSGAKQTSLAPWLIVWAISFCLALLFIAPQPSHPSVQDEVEPRTPFSGPSAPG